MECRCAAMNESFGNEAETYASEHLLRGETSADSFAERYTCPDTGRAFVLDWPERSEREPGPARLRIVAS